MEKQNAPTAKRPDYQFGKEVPQDDPNYPLVREKEPTFSPNKKQKRFNQ